MSEDTNIVVPPELKRNILVTSLDAVYNWARRSSLWPMSFGLACCAIEMICANAARWDMSRFGAEVFRATPRQADLLFVAGTITHKMAPQVRRIYDQMPEPKYVIALGSCAISGGTFNSYAVVQGASEILPIDVYVPGCPPRPEAILQGFMELQAKIDKQSILTVPWYRKQKREASDETRDA